MPRGPRTPSPTLPAACNPCQAPVFFATLPNGHRICLDAQPGPGLVAAYQDATGTWRARHLIQGEQAAPHEKTWSAHTCPTDPRSLP